MKSNRGWLRVLWLTCAALSAARAWAQTPPQSSPPAIAAVPAPSAPVVSPEVSSDHRVTFRLRAPQAKEVSVSGDYSLQQGHADKLVKDEQGVWSFTTEPLRSDYYSYSFSVDGLRIQDPVNVRTKPGNTSTASMFSVPGEQASLLDANDVPHGEVREIFFASKVLGGTRRMHLYLPPGYDAGKQRYPTVYLFHGGGEDDRGWVAIGRINFLLDNLIAQGKAKPMIVVLPSLWALDPAVAEKQVDENDRLVRASLIDEVIPYMEAHYRVVKSSAGRAIGGLGVGRFSTPDIIRPVFDRFDYVVHISGGVDPEWNPLLESRYPGVLDNPANIRRMKFFLGNGTNDHGLPSAQSFAGELKKRGYDTTLFVTDDVHDWTGFRHYFAKFAEQAFR